MFFVYNLVLVLIIFAWAIYQNGNAIYFAYEFTPQTFKEAIDFTAYTFMAEITISPMVYAFLLLVLLIGNAIIITKNGVKLNKKQAIFGTIALALIFVFIITHGILFTMFLEFEKLKNWKFKKLETLHNSYKGIVLTRIALAIVFLVLGVLTITKNKTIKYKK